MTNSKRITGRLAKHLVVFHGYDGNDYTAFVERVHQGVATLTYRVFVGGRPSTVTAYISDPSRIAAA